MHSIIIIKYWLSWVSNLLFIQVLNYGSVANFQLNGSATMLSCIFVPFIPNAAHALMTTLFSVKLKDNSKISGWGKSKHEAGLHECVFVRSSYLYLSPCASVSKLLNTAACFSFCLHVQSNKSVGKENIFQGFSKFTQELQQSWRNV